MLCPAGIIWDVVLKKQKIHVGPWAAMATNWWRWENVTLSEGLCILLCLLTYFNIKNTKKSKPSGYLIFLKKPLFKQFFKIKHRRVSVLKVKVYSKRNKPYKLDWFSEPSWWYWLIMNHLWMWMVARLFKCICLFFIKETFNFSLTDYLK